MFYLYLCLKWQPGFELNAHLKIEPYLKIIITDDEQAFFADLVNQAYESMLFVCQLALAEYLETTWADQFGFIHRQFETSLG